MGKITKPDLGWMAAVIDMKGSIIQKDNKSRATIQYVLRVESAHFPVVQKLGNMTGLSPEAEKERPLKDFMRRRCTEHCPEAHVHVHDDYVMPATMSWTVTGAAAGVVLYNLLPYMTCETVGYRATMQRVFAQATLTGRGSGATRAALFRLQNLGWKLPPEVHTRLLSTPALSA